jgi:hypothetical protein
MCPDGVQQELTGVGVRRPNVRICYSQSLVVIPAF